MRFLILFLSAFFITFTAAAYQVGGANRANFGPGTQQQSAQQYRPFSNYNNRSWGKGVQTQRVQTNIAGSEVTDFDASPKPQAPAVAKKKTVEEPKNKPAAANISPASSAASVPTDSSSALAAQGAVPPDAAAMMQQVQGLMNGMMGGQAPAEKSGANNQAGAGMPAGVPDISALMGGMLPAQPQPVPTKK